MAAGWTAVLALGYVGFSKQAVAQGLASGLLDNLYNTLQLFVLESGAVVPPVSWELQAARYLAPALAMYTAFQASLLFVRQQYSELRARTARNHVVVCGIGLRGMLMCRGFREKGLHVVAIDTRRDNSFLDECRERDVTCLFGDARDPAALRRAGVQKACQVVVTCGADSTNMEVATCLSHMRMGKRSTSLPILVHVVDPELHELLRDSAILMSHPGAVRIELFNTYESGARRLLEQCPPEHGPRDRSPHVMIIGVGGFGAILAVNIARHWHDDVDLPGRPRMTIVDQCNVEQEVEELKLRYPDITRVCDLVPRRVSVDSYEFKSGRLLFEENGECNVSNVYVCLGDDAVALRTALVLSRHLQRWRTPIVVRMSDPTGLTTLLSNRLPDSDDYALRTFDVLQQTCTPDVIASCATEIIARATHENYVRHQLEQGETGETNHALVPWDELPQTLKESNYDQAEHIREKLRAVGCDLTVTSDWTVTPWEFSDSEIELMSRMEHERYVKERRLQGWKWGPVRDVQKKTNPTLVPWEQLDEVEREKDRIAVREMPAFLAQARLKVYRAAHSNRHSRPVGLSSR